MDKEKELIKVKKDIRSLLISSPVGLRLQELLDDYRAMIGKHLPFQELGYSSALDLIKHIPDVVIPIFRAGGVMYLKAVADSSTQHIKQLVEQQKNNGKLSRMRRPPDEAVRRPPEKPTVPFIVRTKLKELLISFYDGLEVEKLNTAYAQRFGQEINHQNLNFVSLRKLLEACSDILVIVERNINGTRTSVVYLKTDVMRSKAADFMNSGSIVLNKQLNQHSAVSSRIPSKAEPTFASTPRNFSHNGKNGRVVSLLDIESDSPAVHANKIQMVNNVEKSVIKIRSGISDELKSELVMLLSNKANGMWLARLPFEYKRKFGKDLDMKSAGYFSLIEMLSSMPDAINIQRPVQNGDWLVSQVKKMPVSRLPNDNDIPENAIGFGEKFCKLSLPTEGQMEITVVHIKDPSCFHFHWHKMKSEFNKLTEKIRSFYNNTASQIYLLPANMTKVGQICCALYDEDGEWYRAKIIRSLSGHEVEVQYVDYGNCAIVEATGLRLLKKDFVALPYMSIGGCLANIRSKDSDSWSIEARKRFFQLTSDRVLTGKIDGFEGHSVLLQLTDANGKHDVHVNDTLVVEEHAVYKSPIKLHPRIAVPNLHSGNAMVNDEMQALFSQRPSQSQIAAGNAAINMEVVGKQLAALDPVTASLIIPFLFTSVQQASNAVNVQDKNVNNAGLFNYASSLLTGNAVIPTIDPGVCVDVTQQNKPMEKTITASNLPSQNSRKAEQLELDRHGDSTEIDLQPFIERSESELPESPVECLFKIKMLATPEPYVIHVIDLEGNLHVPSGEIAALFWHGDILRAMLRREKADVSKKVIARQDHEALFAELVERNVKGITDVNGTKEFLTIYELKCLPTIMNIFKHKSEVLKKCIEDEIAKYNKDPERYWQPVDEDSEVSTDEIEEDSMYMELELEELRLQLQAMQFRKKRLINTLVRKTSSTETMDELKNVENELDIIRKKIRLKEKVFF